MPSCRSCSWRGRSSSPCVGTAGDTSPTTATSTPRKIMRVRSIAEHFAIENDHAYTKSRTTLPSFLERVFVAPRNVNFHLEHGTRNVEPVLLVKSRVTGALNAANETSVHRRDRPAHRDS